MPRPLSRKEERDRGQTGAGSESVGVGPAVHGGGGSGDEADLAVVGVVAVDLEVFGGDVVRAPVPVHGKLSQIEHQGGGVFHGINGPFQATRYHSLVVERASLPADLAVVAQTGDRLIMGLAHARLPVHGVQFHPESIASEHGHLILKNFLEIAAAWNAATGRGTARRQQGRRAR